MAEGDITLFDEFKLALANKEHDLDTDSFKIAILDSTNTPTAADATPNLAAYTEIGTSGSYVAGGELLTNLALTLAAGTVSFTADGPAYWSNDGLNDNDARYGLIYNDTHASDAAVGFIDFAANVDMSVLDLKIDINSLGILTLT